MMYFPRIYSITATPSAMSMALWLWSSQITILLNLLIYVSSWLTIYQLTRKESAHKPILIIPKCWLRVKSWLLCWRPFRSRMMNCSVWNVSLWMYHACRVRLWRKPNFRTWNHWIEINQHKQREIPPSIVN